MAKSEEKIPSNNVDTYIDDSGNVQKIPNISDLSSDVTHIVGNSDTANTRNISELSENVEDDGASINGTSTLHDDTVNYSQSVELQKNNFDFMMRNFKRESSGKVAEIRKREAYVPPSLKRKEKSENARRRKHRFYN